MTKKWTPPRPEDRAMRHALAEVVIMDRLKRANVVGTTSKGRVVIEMVGEPTEAEQLFDSLCKPSRDMEEIIAGGIFSPAAKKLIETQRKEKS